MKKFFTIVVLLPLFFFAACGKNSGEDSKKIKVVCTVFPVYDWTRNIAFGDENLDVSLLIKGGTDLHNYTPTVDDIIKISSADLFIYIGGESDAWVTDVLKQGGNKKQRVLNLMETLGSLAKEEEFREGMECDEGEEEEAYDEHIWLSFRNAVFLCKKIAGVLSEIDSGSAQLIEHNAADYTARLESLNAAAASAVTSGSKKCLLFADRFPFRYFVDDYGLDYYAAFPGCSTESDASFKTIKYLADKIDELELNSICVIDGSDKKIAKLTGETSVRKVKDLVTFDSMQSVSAEKISEGISYISVMEKNVSALKSALE